MKRAATFLLLVVVLLLARAGTAPAAALPLLPQPPAAGSGSQEMFTFMTEAMRGLAASGESAGLVSAPGGAPVYGQPSASIGTYGGWTFWIGWAGSFSDSYLPESETYAWVVYFAPEGMYVALQSAKSNYSAVNVYASIGTFLGMLVSPDGAQLNRSYVDSLLGVTLAVNHGFQAAPFGPLANLGFGMERALTFYRTAGSTAPRRALQYGDGFSVSYDLISIPLPGSVSLDYESAVNAGFYPIYLWNTPPQPGEGPVGAIVRGLRGAAAGGGTSYPAQVAAAMAKILLPILAPLDPGGPVTMDPGTAPSPATFFGHFLQDPSPTVPASPPAGSADDLITQVGEWLETGDTGGLPDAISGGFPGSDNVIGDPWDIFRPIHAGTGLAFELGYQRGCASNPGCTTIYANCLKNIRCVPGTPCLVPVTAAEIAARAGGRPAKYERAWVAFDNPSESFLASQEPETWQQIVNGKAVLTVQQSSATPLVIGVRTPASPATGGRNVELCRRILSFGPSVKVQTVDRLASEPGRNTAAFRVVRSEVDAEPLVVRYRLGGRARNGVDYAELDGTVTIPAGSASALVRIQPLDDRGREGNESVTLTLDWGSTYLIGRPAGGTATILDND